MIEFPHLKRKLPVIGWTTLNLLNVS
uniref:Uncharacterized protein n=1 Tax=Arundo donax TaxID=35708 RepID=A0A0A9FYI6_ARUDO